MTFYPRNGLKRRLAERKTALGFWLSFNSLSCTEMAAGAGYDWLLLDAEHVLHNAERIEQHVLAAHHARSDAELVVRVPATDPVLVKQLLDAGVRSFMFPFVQTLEEARLAVASTRYPPRGVRGFSGVTRANAFGRDRDYTTSYEDDLLVILQIESPQAVANIARYAGVDGVDALLIGAWDLAANMGQLANPANPDVVAKFDEAAVAIMASGKPAGFQNFDRAAAKRLIERGFTLAAVTGDVPLLQRGAAEVLAALR